MVTFEGEPSYDQKCEGVTFRARQDGKRLMCDVSTEFIQDELVGDADETSEVALVEACRSNFERLKNAAEVLIDASRIDQREDNVGVMVDRVLIANWR
jgi:hypothetical protein